MNRKNPKKRIQQQRVELSVAMMMLAVVIAIGHYYNYEDAGGSNWMIGLAVGVGYTWSYFRLKNYFLCGTAMIGGLAMLILIILGDPELMSVYGRYEIVLSSFLLGGWIVVLAKTYKMLFFDNGVKIGKRKP